MSVVEIGLTQQEARLLTDDIRQDAERLWSKLLEAYEGGAHTALGYSSWGAYYESEFGGSKRRGYQLLDAGRVLESVHNCALKPANEAQARELVPLIDRPQDVRDAWREASANGEPAAAKVREVVQSRMGVHYSSETPEWSTPQDLFDQLDAEFHFTLDVCATAANAKCEQFYTEADDGLAQPWSGVCWMNPPYGSTISDWMEKAYLEMQGGATVVCLVPARTDTAWWWDFCRWGEVRFLRGRLKFGDSANSAPFPSAVVVLASELDANTTYWERS